MGGGGREDSCVWEEGERTALSGRSEGGREERGARRHLYCGSCEYACLYMYAKDGVCMCVCVCV